ncbi:hypothetical protein G3580_18175 [Nitrogeniibacter mangrovi]|uniref:Uncharacterized protein n=1 Tax=Nitrogeniibacter mangrovi TaxID=2016596 RepID=A0A6C1B6L0_9RHOO|nr:hypothetical protein [Nitrogeniibacter mangrovi]QID19372.1 hypothetical protein G3580_18175 [Nitrogeniibacter mangrovi]
MSVPKQMRRQLAALALMGFGSWSGAADLDPLAQAAVDATNQATIDSAVKLKELEVEKARLTVEAAHIANLKSLIPDVKALKRDSSESPTLDAHRLLFVTAKLAALTQPLGDEIFKMMGTPPPRKTTVIVLNGRQAQALIDQRNDVVATLRAANIGARSVLEQAARVEKDCGKPSVPVPAEQGPRPYSFIGGADLAETLIGVQAIVAFREIFRTQVKYQSHDDSSSVTPALALLVGKYFKEKQIPVIDITHLITLNLEPEEVGDCKGWWDQDETKPVGGPIEARGDLFCAQQKLSQCAKLIAKRIPTPPKKGDADLVAMYQKVVAAHEAITKGMTDMHAESAEKPRSIFAGAVEGEALRKGLVGKDIWLLDLKLLAAHTDNIARDRWWSGLKISLGSFVSIGWHLASSNDATKVFSGIAYDKSIDQQPIELDGTNTPLSLAAPGTKQDQEHDQGATTSKGNGAATGPLASAD